MKRNADTALDVAASLRIGNANRGAAGLERSVRASAHRTTYDRPYGGASPSRSAHPNARPSPLSTSVEGPEIDNPVEVEQHKGDHQQIDDQGSDEIKFFQQRILPQMVGRTLSCHSRSIE